jgi:alpha-glucosidase
MQLLPHFYRLAYEAYKTGIPIIRPLFLEFQDDEETNRIWEQVMIGDNIMIAPVLKSKIKTQQIYFPEGTWYSWWDDSIYQGPEWYEVAINEDHVPLFVRGIIVLGPKLQSISEDHRFDTLNIHLYPPFEGATYLYEDDGTTTGYLSEKCSIQTISISHDKKNRMISVLFEPAAGSFENQPEHRSITLVLHGIGKATNVFKGNILLGSDSIHEDKILTIDTMIPVKEQTEIRILLEHK